MRSRDAVAVAEGESARLLFALNDAANEDARRLGHQISGQLGTLLDGELRLAAPVNQRCAHGTSRMRSALRAAAELREASAAQASRTESELARREAALRHAIGLLDRAGELTGLIAGRGGKPGLAA